MSQDKIKVLRNHWLKAQTSKFLKNIFQKQSRKIVSISFNSFLKPAMRNHTRHPFYTTWLVRLTTIGTCKARFGIVIHFSYLMLIKLRNTFLRKFSSHPLVPSFKTKAVLSDEECHTLVSQIASIVTTPSMMLAEGI